MSGGDWWGNVWGELSEWRRVPWTVWGRIVGRTIRGNVQMDVRIPMQNYKSLCVAVMISGLSCTETHTDTQTAFDRLYY